MCIKMVNSLLEALAVGMGPAPLLWRGRRQVWWLAECDVGDVAAAVVEVELEVAVLPAAPPSSTASPT
ncbi:hypothetical protein GCM10020216_083510 [Nonomuraea helvata]